MIYRLVDWFNCRYLVTEGQIFSVYLITFVVMIGYMVYKKQKHNAHLDINGQFLLYSFALCFILILIWVSYLWNDEALRVKYPGLLYIPEPWSYYTLYIKPWFNTVNNIWLECIENSSIIYGRKSCLLFSFHFL